VRWGLLGLVSGVLSCVVSQSYLLVHDQKTLDHIVWPGLVFALVVLLPLSRWAGDGWLRTAAALIASSAAYPIAWWIAASTTRHPGAYMVGAFAFSGFWGSLVLGSVFLFGRPGWVRAAGTTVVLGTVIGGLMGADLLAAASFHSGRDGLGVFMVVWQTVVGASLGRGIPARPNHAPAPTGGPATPPGDSGASGGAAIGELSPHIGAPLRAGVHAHGGDPIYG
jgi:hypothetical protein